MATAREPRSFLRSRRSSRREAVAAPASRRRRPGSPSPLPLRLLIASVTPTVRPPHPTSLCLPLGFRISWSALLTDCPTRAVRWPRLIRVSAPSNTTWEPEAGRSREQGARSEGARHLCAFCCCFGKDSAYSLSGYFIFVHLYCGIG